MRLLAAFLSNARPPAEPGKIEAQPAGLQAPSQRPGAPAVNNPRASFAKGLGAYLGAPRLLP